MSPPLLVIPAKAGIPLLLAAILAAGCSGTTEAARVCAGPRPGWQSQRDGIPAETFLIDRVRVEADGSLRWNGARIDRATLGKYMRALGTSEPHPFVILDPDPRADCGAVDAAREVMDRSGSCSAHGCGEGHGDWTSADPHVDANSAAYRAMARDAERVGNAAIAGGYK